MGVRNSSVASNTILASVPATGAETVLVTSPPINLTLDGAQLLIFWYLRHTIGAGTTSTLVRLRRGTTTGGTLINVAVGNVVTVGDTPVLSGVYPDTPGIVAEQQYSLSASGVGTTGAFTTQDVALVVMVL